MEKDSYQVLHCHTKLSDGTLSHREVLDKCRDNNIEVVAFTDHDILMTDETVNDLKKLNHQVKFISGIEFSVTGTPEVKGASNCFILLDFCGPQEQCITKVLYRRKKKRRERIALFVSKLNAIGFSVTEEEVDKETSEGTLGRPHLAKAILAKEENFAVIDRALLQLKKKGRTIRHSPQNIKK